jgi:hypothetical protein
MNVSLIARLIAAIGGGYVLASLLTADIALALRAVGSTPADAVIGSNLLSIVLYAAIVMAVFHARTATRAWLWLGITAVPLTAVLLLLRTGAE